ncbi:MAG: hypothetical protein H6639_14885 [Caldilineaceae bacterium]|nr:hypothetical protein [Caldilineaceae bacterium]
MGAHAVTAAGAFELPAQTEHITLAQLLLATGSAPDSDRAAIDQAWPCLVASSARKPKQVVTARQRAGEIRMNCDQRGTRSAECLQTPR